MTTLLYTHEACLAHDPGSYHPESPDRLRAVLDGLSDPAFAALERRTAPPADIEEVMRVHSRRFVETVLAAVPSRGHAALDADTVLSPRSGEAALCAVGAVCAAIDAVIAGEAENAFCAVRPPGHHAEPEHAMGFCLFNTVAIGAQRARQVHGLERVAVIDFDVHHGNGTQAAFENDPRVFYGSTHQSPLYPGTGSRAETGVGNIVNVPLRPMAGSADFRHAFDREGAERVDAAEAVAARALRGVEQSVGRAELAEEAEEPLSHGPAPFWPPARARALPCPRRSKSTAGTGRTEGRAS